MFSIKLKDEILKSKDPKFVSTYNSAIYTEDQENIISEFNSQFKKELIKNLEEIYVKPGIMKKKELFMNLNKWINSI